MEDFVLNASKNVVDPWPRDESLARVEIGILSSIFVVGVFGNGLVLLALHVRKSRRPGRPLPKMYFLIFHLGVADLINAFFNILPQLLWDVTDRFKGGEAACKAVKYGQLVGPYLSTYVLTATALDRHRAVRHPLTYRFWSGRKSKVLVGCAWAVSIVFSIPQMFVFSYREVAPGVWDCWATFSTPWGERIYVFWYCVSAFVVPLTALIYTYVEICRVIWRRAGRGGGKQRPFPSRAKINSVKQTLAAVAAYAACSLPFVAAELWAAWDPTARDSASTGPVFTIFVLLSSLNSCANPWIFMTFNSDLFESLRIFFKDKLFSSTCNDATSFECSLRKKKENQKNF